MNFKETGSKWLWYDDDCLSENQYVAFRQEINIEKTDNSYIYISCDTNYALWVNEKFVNCGQFLANPQNKFYDKIPLDGFLNKKRNVIGILVYYQGVGSQCYSRGSAGLIYAVKTGDSWLSDIDSVCGHVSGFSEGKLPLITSQIGPSFVYDARLEQSWMQENLPANCKMIKSKQLDFCEFLPEKIAARPVKKLDISNKTEFNIACGGEFIYKDPEEKTAALRMQNAYMKTDFHDSAGKECVIPKNKNTFVIIDLGSEKSGYFEMDITACEGVRIDVSYGEHLDDLRVRSAIEERNFAFTVYTKNGRQEFTNYFRRIAGRYIQLNFNNPDKDIVVHYAGMRMAEYPLIRRKPLVIKDKLHSIIYETGIETLRQCMHEHYEDCPWREQALYGFDSRNQALAGYGEFINGEFIKASLMLMDSSLGNDGYQAMCVPSDVPTKIPSYSLMWVVFACEYVEHYKDFKTGNYFYGRIIKMLDSYWENAQNGILPVPQGGVYWNFYDWADGIDGIQNNKFTGADEKTRFCSIYNLYYLYAVKKTIKLANMLNKPYLELRKRVCSLKIAVNESFFDRQTGLYKTYLQGKHFCQLSQALAMLCDIADNEKILTESLKNPKLAVETTLCTAIFKYDALMRKKKNYSFILDEIADIWGGMLRNGATTFFETEKGASDFAYAGSLCHGWSAVPVYVYRKIFDEK